MQWITHAIDNYIRALVKRYRQRDREIEEQKSLEAGRPVSLPQSDELYLLTKYRWLAAVTRYAVGLVFEPKGFDDEAELIILKEMLLERYRV